MKRFIITCAVIICAAAIIILVSNRAGLYVDINPSKQVNTFTEVSGKEILVDQGNGMEPFEIRGVNMGVGIPGHFATDYAIDKGTYLRWFGMIQEMGANCVRVYTILPPQFYEAVWEYNNGREKPLYIIHGLWVDDYVQFSHVDGYDDDFLGAMLEESRILVDIIHGNKSFSLGEDIGSGSYTKDVSPWVIGYILGVEWEDTTVAYTDHMENDKNSYKGEYMYTSEEASPFEAMLAQAGDKIISYETGKYKTQRLIAFANWPTTDPLDWDDLVNYYFRKFEKVDVEHIRTTDKFLSGQFASYHIYPYYPDYLGFMDTMDLEVEEKEAWTDETGVFNSYAAYLEMINQHHTMPVVIAEYGVPSSRGRAQSDRNTGRAQGGMSEEDQADAIVTCYQDIMEAGCAGSIVFSWQDEWFKRTWNTMAYTDLTKTPFWSDYQTNEQYFGILSFDPGNEKSVCYVDGDTSEWTEDDLVAEQDGISLYCKYDEKYVYFYVKKKDFNPLEDIICLPIDTTQKTGSTMWDGADNEFERPADFLVILSGKDDSRILVQERYEALRAVYSHRVYGKDAYLDPPAKDTPEFVPIKLLLQIPEDPHDELSNIRFDTGESFDTGNLTYGNGNPDSDDFNSLADFIYSQDGIELRLPWSLLNFCNPSEMMIHDDYYEHYGIEGIQIDEMYAGAGILNKNDSKISMGTIPLKGWGRNPTYHERLKEGYYELQKLWTDGDKERE